MSVQIALLEQAEFPVSDIEVGTFKISKLTLFLSSDIFSKDVSCNFIQMTLTYSCTLSWGQQ